MKQIGSNGQNLIFLISQPRAGSTLLQRILSNHPDIYTATEPWIMLHPIYALRETGQSAEYNSRWAQIALQDFLKYEVNGVETYYEALRAFSRVLYQEVLTSSKKKFFLDKTPRYYLIIPELYRLFPEAKFIILLRNPLAVLHSIITTWIKTDWYLLANFAIDLLVAPNCLIEASKTLANNTAVISYESFVTEPENTIKKLFLQLNIQTETLDYSQMLNYGNNNLKGRFGDPIGVKKHTAPVTNSLDSWKTLADNPQTRHFAITYLEELGAETIENLGYSYKELKEDVIPASNFKSSNQVIPWHIATRPYMELSINEKLIVKKVMAIQSKGTWRGNFEFTKDLFSAWLNRTIGSQF
ncbi:MAG: sulfotransferase [Anaerolineaceae bacterium]|nr:sulfotransferase [Anaerolineaceae bacterium]